MAEPDEYYKSTTLNLYFKEDNKVIDCSVDEAGAVKFGGDKSKANTHGTWVQQVQKDLITLGYLPEKDAKSVEMADGYYGRSSFRAIKRFQRHAARLYRMDTAKAIQDVAAADVFAGKETGNCDSATATEIRKWIDKKWVNPVGRFKLVAVKSDPIAKMRSDAKDKWEAIMDKVEGKGGNLKGPYGDTFRPLALGGGKKGSSKWSVHHSGRAIDINQDKKLIVKDLQGSDMFWKVFQKTDKQDGTQGAKIEKGAFKVYNHKANTETDIPAGYYLNLTDEIQVDGDFKRIHAQGSWEDRADYDAAAANLKTVQEDKAATDADKSAAKTKANNAYQSLYNKQEWWHFQYAKDWQVSFIDDLELIGFSESDVRQVKDKDGNLKWSTDGELDVAPG